MATPINSYDKLEISSWESHSIWPQFQTNTTVAVVAIIGEDDVAGASHAKDDSGDGDRMIFWKREEIQGMQWYFWVLKKFG